MMNNERDISIDTTENAMLKLLRSQTSGILNIPQGCDRIRDIFIVEISRQYWTHISKQKPEAKPRTSHPTSFRQSESYSKRSFAGGGAEILDTRLDASTQNVTSLQEAVYPFTGWGREIQVSQLPDENVRQDCVKRRTKVNKKHPDIIPLFFQVTCCSVWWTVAIASAVDLFAL